MDYARRTRRRMTLTVVLLLAVVAVFIVRLVDIQVVQAEQLREDSAGKRSISTIVYGARGNIVDADGTVIADTVERYDITASPRYAQVATFDRTIDGKKVKTTREEALTLLAEATGESVDDIRAALDADPTSDFAYLSKDASLQVRDAVVDLHISWVYPRSHPARTYPLGAIGGNLIGFIGTDGPLAGLERSEDSCLAADDGSETFERGGDGVKLPGSTVTTDEATDGGTLQLTIDSDFQWFLQQALAEGAQNYGAPWGTAVVVRVADGHIMGIADYPTVDPNDFTAVDSDSRGSRAFAQPYEPGSTFKAMTAAMLLDAGVVTQTTQISAPGVLNVKGGYIKDVFAHGTMRWTTTGVLINSSNIGISILSEKLDKTKREAYMRKFGLGERTAVDFLGESKGLLTDPKGWDPITEKAVAFGQGVSATSAQVASIYQTLGNDGVRMPLTLVEGCTLPDGTVTELPSTEGTQVVSKKAANQTVEMLENVVTQGGLTTALTIDGYNIAAKTGTAQVAKKGGGGYGTDRVVSVAGLIPGDDPQYAVVVTLGNPTTMKTSAAAAPTFTKVMNQIIKTFKVTPSTTKVPDLPEVW